MIIFGDEFIKTKGQPINYKNKLIMMGDYFFVPIGKSMLHFKFISTNSEWKQAIKLSLKGSISINNRTFKNGLGLWEHTAPKEGVFMVDSKDGKILVSNAWQTPDGTVHSWEAGGALYFEEIKKGRRYYCNDGHIDDDFKDLIFEITQVKSNGGTES